MVILKNHMVVMWLLMVKLIPMVVLNLYFMVY